MERYINLLIGLLALAGIVAAIVKRPIMPKFTRWISEHQTLIERVGPFIFILWGGAIWALILLKRNFSNVFAMVGGSVIFCTGVFFFLKLNRRV